MTHALFSAFLRFTAHFALAISPTFAQSPPPRIWQTSARIDDPAATADFHFGSAIALDGDTLAVTQRGDVQVFVRTGATWTRQAVLTPSEPHSSDIATLGLHGDNLVLGRPKDTPGSDFSIWYGTVYIYHRSGTTWAQEFMSIGPALDQLGTAVALHGDVACTTGGDSLVPVRIYRRSGTSWNLEASFPLTGGPIPRAAALEDDSLLVNGWNGVTGSSNFISLIREYRRVAGSWVQQPDFVVQPASPDFTQPLARSGDTFVVGAPDHDAFGTDAGVAYVFALHAGVWIQEATLLPCDLTDGSHFGRSVAIDGPNVVVGAQTPVDGPGSASGAVYVFAKTAVGWVQRQKLTLPAEPTSGGFGQSVALSGSTIAGASLRDDAALADTGAVYVFDRRSPTSQNFCFGDGSGTPCPCGNEGEEGNGCGNFYDPPLTHETSPSLRPETKTTAPLAVSGWTPALRKPKPPPGPGARLDAYGLASVSDDHVVLSCIGVPPGAGATFWQGSVQQSGGFGVQSFDGLGCIAGSIVRIGTRSSCVGKAAYPEGAEPRVSVQGGVPAGGGTRHYQVSYSGVTGPCGTQTNYTNGATVTWAP